MYTYIWGFPKFGTFRVWGTGGLEGGPSFLESTTCLYSKTSWRPSESQDFLTGCRVVSERTFLVAWGISILPIEPQQKTHFVGLFEYS